MAKEKTVKVSIRVSESLYTELSDNAGEEYRELAAHCRYLIVKFIENYVTEKALDISFPILCI